MNVRARIFIEGKVQGVFFRQSTYEMANLVGVFGWVRNCHDGRVEAVFEGEKAHVDQAIVWCKQGPPAAQVTNIEIDWQDFQGEHNDFQVRY